MKQAHINHCTQETRRHFSNLHAILEKVIKKDTMHCSVLLSHCPSLNAHILHEEGIQLYEFRKFIIDL
jgi:hypothetical protein